MSGGSSSSASSTTNKYTTTTTTTSLTGIQGPAITGSGNTLFITDQGAIKAAKEMADRQALTTDRTIAESMGVVSKTVAGAFDVAGATVNAEVYKNAENQATVRAYLDQVGETSRDVIDMAYDTSSGAFSLARAVSGDVVDLAGDVAEGSNSLARTAFDMADDALSRADATLRQLFAGFGSIIQDTTNEALGGVDKALTMAERGNQAAMDFASNYAMANSQGGAIAVNSKNLAMVAGVGLVSVTLLALLLRGKK